MVLAQGRSRLGGNSPNVIKMHVVGANNHTDIVRAPQPDTAKDYVLQYRPTDDADWQALARVERNHQRMRRHEFKPTQAAAVRLLVTATNGDKLARVHEVRCYGLAYTLFRNTALRSR